MNKLVSRLVSVKISFVFVLPKKKGRFDTNKIDAAPIKEVTVRSWRIVVKVLEMSVDPDQVLLIAVATIFLKAASDGPGSPRNRAVKDLKNEVAMRVVAARSASSFLSRRPSFCSAAM